MALHFSLKINTETIGMFTAVRKSGGTDPDDMNTYEVTVETRPLTAHHRQIAVQSFTLEHRYGDGAWALVRKALVNVWSDHPDFNKDWEL
ncbi:hypothetical protein ACIGKR_12125 [Rhodococcus qingshengii]|uniref:hypothetical protein n=1 Tax=Rhodococcus erythropolis group TaxID=2840174 RepID=UPI00366EAA9D